MSTTDLDAIYHEAIMRRLAVEAALIAGRRRFRDRRRDRHTLTVTRSARPDCPEGYVQLTRWDGGEPTGHTYADARGDWVAVSREIWAQGYDA